MLNDKKEIWERMEKRQHRLEYDRQLKRLLKNIQILEDMIKKRL